MPRPLLSWLCSLTLAAGACLVAVSPTRGEEAGEAVREAADETPAEEEAETDETVPGTDETVPGTGESDEEASDESASDDVPAGHSSHGEVFNRGPRQRAYLMGGTGKVHFPVSTEHDEAQRFFEQGVGQLHGFWYFEAERSFRQAAMLDPDCAMNYWGMAMANLDNAKRSRSFMEEAVERKGSVSPREVLYIDALNAYVTGDPKQKKERSEALTKALEDILFEYPDDLEAKAFLALQFYKNKSVGISPQSYLTVDALLSEIFAVEPMHPAHHYRIHWWDGKRPVMALESAVLAGQSAPAIAHMWHMPGHIFSKLKRYEDAVWQQEASARVDHAHMMRDRVQPDRIHNFAHNNEWLIRNLGNIGRVRDAVDLAKNMTELPRHPDYNTLSKRGSAYYGRKRLLELLSEYELWNEAIELCHTPHLEATDDEAEQIKRLRLLGRAYYATGDIEHGDAQLEDLRGRLEKVQAERDEAGTQAKEKAGKEGKDDKAVAKAMTVATRRFSARVKNAERGVHELESRRAVAAEEYDTGLERLTKAGDVDELDLARVRSLAGEIDRAVEDVRAEVSRRENEVRPLAILVDLLWRNGREDEAKQVFGELRPLSRQLDVDSPVFARLAPVAAALDLPADWRTGEPGPTDVGVRPPLDELGPFRWQPSPAPEWTLEDAEGHEHSLADYRGKPIVLVFYLGFGCLHCAEQLQAFGPLAKDFEAHGLTLVAISSDDAAGLKQSIEDYTGGPMPIQLLTNGDLDVFKRYRCFDDFEQQTLHGTFVIDGEGLVRWQDVSYEPFLKPRFVLEEAVRLLGPSNLSPAVEPNSTPATESTPAATATTTSAPATSAGEER